MRNLLIRLGSSALLAATLGVGAVYASGGHGENSIRHTGPDSVNKIVESDRSSFKESNNTSVDVSNSNWQSARSGDAVVSHNTWGGDATSGDARNSNWQSTNVSVRSNAHMAKAGFETPRRVKSAGRTKDIGQMEEHHPM